MVAGCCTGLLTQLFHNTALTAGRIAEVENRTPTTMECLNRCIKEHGDPAPINSNLTETCDETKGYSNNCKDENGDSSRCRLCATCIGVGKLRYKRTGGSTRDIRSLFQVQSEDSMLISLNLHTISCWITTLVNLDLMLFQKIQIILQDH